MEHWDYFYSGARKYLQRARESSGLLRQRYLGVAESFRNLMDINLRYYGGTESENKKFSSELEHISSELDSEFNQN